MENYFNYFTEIEECYRRCRNTPGLLSPLDWALIESWKEAGVPLPAVIAGIERAFAKFQKRPRHIQKVNSLAYCAQLVLAAAEEMKAAGSHGEGGAASAAREEVPPFSEQEVSQYLTRNAEQIEQAARREQASGQAVLAEDFERAAATLREATERLASKVDQTLEDLERLLASLEEILHAAALRASPVELLTSLRAEVDRSLGPYRRNMTAAQLDSLERQFLKKRLFEHYQLPRLSLFYL